MAPTAMSVAWLPEVFEAQQFEIKRLAGGSVVEYKGHCFIPVSL